jgi:hypothetical protein
MRISLINIPSDSDFPIYRVFDSFRFINSFESSQLSFVHPSLWDDPFENLLMNSTGIFPDGVKMSFEYRKYFYCQCWSRIRESDALWRIYAPNKMGIKVKSSIRKVQNSLMTDFNKNLPYDCYIGLVKYYSKDKILDIIKNQYYMHNLLLDSTLKSQAESLLFKRIPFSHEKEIRIIMNTWKVMPRRIIKVKANLNELIEEIVLDPRMDDQNVQMITNRLIDLGFNKRIIQSGLYRLPHMIIKV